MLIRELLLHTISCDTFKIVVLFDQMLEEKKYFSYPLFFKASARLLSRDTMEGQLIFEKLQ